MELPLIYSPEDMTRLVSELGFLPFFKNRIPGFSVEECCPPELWFSDTADGPWEWKGPAARGRTCIYGKIFSGKAGFVSREWLADFVNFRRDGYDFDSRCDDGLAAAKDIEIFSTVAREGQVLSKKLKADCGYCKNGKKGFETVITRLQMQTYVVISDFRYMTDKKGRQYGWGIAEYSTPEQLFGRDEVTAAYCRTPEESGERIRQYLDTFLPENWEKNFQI